MKMFGASRDGKPTSGSRHTSTVTDILFANQSKPWIITRSSDGLVMCWRHDAAGEKLNQPVVRVSSVNRLEITSDGRYLVIGHDSGRVCRWDLSLDEPTFDSPQLATGSSVTALDVSRDGDPRAVVGYSDGSVRLFNLSGEKASLIREPWTASEVTPAESVKAQAISYPPIESVVFSSGSKYILTFSHNPADRGVPQGRNTVVLAWPVEGPALSHRVDVVPQISRLTVAVDEQMLALGFESDIKSHSSGITAFSLAYESAEDLLQLITDPKEDVSNEILRKGPEHFRYRVAPLAISPVLKTMKTRYIIGGRRLWYDPGGKTEQDSSNYGWVVYQVVQERRLVRVSKDDLRPLLPLPDDVFHPASVLAFSADGGWLAAGFNDGTTCVWNTLDLRQPPEYVLQPGISSKSLASSSSAVSALCFQSQTKGKPWLFTGYADGTVRRWDLSKQKSIEQAKQAIEQQYQLNEAG